MSKNNFQRTNTRRALRLSPPHGRTPGPDSLSPVSAARALQDIAHASRISPAMLSSYLTGREMPTLKTLEKLLDGLKLRLEDLASALHEVEGHARREPARSASEDLVLAFPHEEVERVFVDQLRRLDLEPKRKAEEPAAPHAKPPKS